MPPLTSGTSIAGAYLKVCTSSTDCCEYPRRFFSLGDVFSLTVPTSDADITGIPDPVVSVLEGGSACVWHFQVVELQPPPLSTLQPQHSKESAVRTIALDGAAAAKNGAAGAGQLPLRIDPLTSTEVSLVVSGLGTYLWVKSGSRNFVALLSVTFVAGCNPTLCWLSLLTGVLLARQKQGHVCGWGTLETPLDLHRPHPCKSPTPPWLHLCGCTLAGRERPQPAACWVYGMGRHPPCWHVSSPAAPISTHSH
jgi:hypothetical protein